MTVREIALGGILVVTLSVAGQVGPQADDSCAVANIVNFVRSFDPRMDRTGCTQALDDEVNLNLRHGLVQSAARESVKRGFLRKRVVD